MGEFLDVIVVCRRHSRLRVVTRVPVVFDCGDFPDIAQHGFFWLHRFPCLGHVLLPRTVLRRPCAHLKSLHKTTATSLVQYQCRPCTQRGMKPRVLGSTLQFTKRSSCKGNGGWSTLNDRLWRKCEAPESPLLRRSWGKSGLISDVTKL